MAARAHDRQELEDVVTWRREQLRHSGFPCRLASRLADDTRFDLHALIELVEHGCPPHVAVRILAPLDVAPRRSSESGLLPSDGCG